MNSKIQWITRTAVFLAVLIALQFATGKFPQLVTGSVVNFVLIACVLVCGLSAGLTIAVLSPFFAFILGIVHALPPLLPVIALGNAVIVLMVYVICKQMPSYSAANLIKGAAAIFAGAAVKALFLWAAISKLLIPALAIPAKQAAALTLSFSWPQFTTALIGGALALIVVPALSRAINKS